MLRPFSSISVSTARTPPSPPHTLTPPWPPHSTSQRHWNEWHRVSCVASALSGAADAQERRRSCRVVSSISDCLICLAEFVDCARQTLLPCGHTFCTACLDSLGKAKGAQRACPLCRAPLPPSAKRLLELSERTIRKVATALGWAGGVGSGGECQWPSLSASQEGSVQDAIVMLEEAIDQVSGRMGAGGPGDGAVMGLLALAHVAHVAGAGCADAGAIGPGEGPPPRSTRFSTSYTGWCGRARSQAVMWSSHSPVYTTARSNHRRGINGTLSQNTSSFMPPVYTGAECILPCTLHDEERAHLLHYTTTPEYAWQKSHRAAVAYAALALQYNSICYSRAVPLLEHAAERGDGPCLYQLGMVFLDAKVDFEHAFGCFEKAADKGHAEAHTMLGWMCEHGRGCSPSCHVAMAKYTLAVDLGCNQAARYMRGLKDTLQEVGSNTLSPFPTNPPSRNQPRAQPGTNTDLRPPANAKLSCAALAFLTLCFPRTVRPHDRYAGSHRRDRKLHTRCRYRLAFASACLLQSAC